MSEAGRSPPLWAPMAGRPWTEVELTALAEELRDW